ncbi:MAG: F0F1 ATP synthase subunit epsilon [Acidobacteriota bacterium]|nr:F0F1 ATP synthase subunit epsilon [Acidobacteriota bacterium]
MADSFQLEIVTPEKAVVRETATEAQIPGKKGYLGILPGHAPLITELAVGEISYKKPGGGEEHLAVAWGFAEVLPNKVIILAETAEKAADIDVARAEQQKKRAEEHLRSLDPDTDFERAGIALERALIRIQVAGKRGYIQA